MAEHLRTNQRHIYAAADCVGGYQFTHYAGCQGFMAVRNAILPFNKRSVLEQVPWATFTDPEVAHVGLTKAQADEMYRYLAIANYEDRFVIPTSHRELAKEAFPDATAYGERGGCGFSFGDGCNGGDSDFSLFGGKKQTTSMVSKLATVKQVDPKQLQD